MFPDFSELIKAMNRVVEELKESRETIRENTRTMQKLLKALEV